MPWDSGLVARVWVAYSQILSWVARVCFFWSERSVKLTLSFGLFLCVLAKICVWGGGGLPATSACRGTGGPDLPAGQRLMQRSKGDVCRAPPPPLKPPCSLSEIACRGRVWHTSCMLYFSICSSFVAGSPMLLGPPHLPAYACGWAPRYKSWLWLSPVLLSPYMQQTWPLFLV